MQHDSFPNKEIVDARLTQRDTHCWDLLVLSQIYRLSDILFLSTKWPTQDSPYKLDRSDPKQEIPNKKPYQIVSRSELRSSSSTERAVFEFER